MGFKLISKKALMIWELFALVIYVVIFILTTCFVEPFSLLWKIIVWSMLVVLLAIEIIYLPFRYASTKYKVTNEMIIYQKGVFFNQKSYMKTDRIVFVTVFKTPLTPIFKISSLIISATGSKIVIPFLDNDIAEQFALFLSPEIET